MSRKSERVVWGVASALKPRRGARSMVMQGRYCHHHTSCWPSLASAQHATLLSTRSNSLFASSSSLQQQRKALITRHMSTTTSSSEKSITTTNDDQLLHPDQLGDNGTMPYPTSLSPSAISAFKQCPQSFLFQYIWGLRQPTNAALAKGSMCHAALEQVFDLPPEHRTLDNLQNLFRREWGKHRLREPYDQLFVHENASHDIQAEVAWGQESLRLLEQYMQSEDPATVPRPNPVQREVWVRSDLTIQPEAGVTGYTAAETAPPTADDTTNGNTNNDNKDTFLVRGIIDRLDMVSVAPTTPSEQQPQDRVVLRLIDYKTGKAPLLKYSTAVNQRIQAEAFEQLLIYALLWREQNHARHSKNSSNSYNYRNNNKNKNDPTNNMPLRYLRLFYLTSHDETAQAMDLDLGATAAERDAVLQRVHADLASVWNSLMELVSLQDPTAWPGCDRSFCYCHSCRARFVPGTVWEPPAAAATVTSVTSRSKNQGLAA